MILGFKTQINGKPTHFVSKIWSGIQDKFSKFSKDQHRVFDFPKEYIECGQKGLLNFILDKPKIHTIREDKTNRWKAGIMIDYFINVRTKDMYRFAPRLPVVSTQPIIIHWISNIRSLEVSNMSLTRLNYVDVIVGNKLLEVNEIKELAVNDGFDSIDAFFDYFNESFEGKIIHWTDKQY